MRAAVDELVTGWLERTPREEYGLIVARTHGHGDHVAGSWHVFADRAGTVVIARQPEARPNPAAHRFDDFIIFSGPCRAAVVRQLARTAWRRVTRQKAAAP